VSYVYTEGPAITDQEYGEISCSKYEVVILERIEETDQEWRARFHNR
jgi:transcription initiation factor TFIIIB Brf1 subunit/transcription initiation factor TFIIB